MKYPEEMASRVFFNIISRLDDEETTVVDLAFKTLIEVWFPEHHLSWESMSTSQKNNQKNLTIGICNAISGSPKEEELLSRLFEKINRGSPVIIDSLVDLCKNDLLFEKALWVLKLLAPIFPNDFQHHLNILESYIKPSVNIQSQHATSIIYDIFTIVVPKLDAIDSDFVKQMEVEITAILLSANRIVLESCVPCLVVLHKYSHSTEKLKGITINCLIKIKTFMNEEFFSDASNPRFNIVFRLILLISLMKRYYSECSNLTEIYDIIMWFCKNMASDSLWVWPVIAMGNCFLGNPSKMLEGGALSFIGDIFISNCSKIKGEMIKVILYTLENPPNTAINTPVGKIDLLENSENDGGVSTGIFELKISDYSDFLDACPGMYEVVIILILDLKS
jgi:hypothetical protein